MTQEKPDNIMNSQRKSPTQGRSKTMVSAIFEAAARVLPKSGYEGVTTNQLAKIAGVSVGSLYQYFSNKDEISLQILNKISSCLFFKSLCFCFNSEILWGTT